MKSNTILTLYMKLKKFFFNNFTFHNKKDHLLHIKGNSANTLQIDEKFEITDLGWVVDTISNDPNKHLDTKKINGKTIKGIIETEIKPNYSSHKHKDINMLNSITAEMIQKLDNKMPKRQPDQIPPINKANRDKPFGHASLDSNGKIPRHLFEVIDNCFCKFDSAYDIYDSEDTFLNLGTYVYIVKDSPSMNQETVYLCTRNDEYSGTLTHRVGIVGEDGPKFIHLPDVEQSPFSLETLKTIKNYIKLMHGHKDGIVEKLDKIRDLKEDYELYGGYPVYQVEFYTAEAHFPVNDTWVVPFIDFYDLIYDGEPTDTISIDKSKFVYNDTRKDRIVSVFWCGVVLIAHFDYTVDYKSAKITFKHHKIVKDDFIRITIESYDVA